MKIKITLSCFKIQEEVVFCDLSYSPEFIFRVQKAENVRFPCESPCAEILNFRKFNNFNVPMQRDFHVLLIERLLSILKNIVFERLL